MRGPWSRTSRFHPRDWWTAAFVVGAVVGVVALVGLVRSVPSDGPSDTAVRTDWRAEGGRPQALSEPGAVISSDVGASGTIRVVHWIRTEAPVRRVTLSVPDLSPPGLPSARRVLVEDPGGAVLAATSGVGGEARELVLSRPARLLRLTYELTGVVDRSASVTGRALAGITFLDVDAPHRTGPTKVVVTGWRVLNLGCVTAPDLASQPCGAPAGRGWSVTLSPEERDAQVIAQLDLGQVSWAAAP